MPATQPAPQVRPMIPDIRLTPAQREAYARDGFTILGRVLDDAGLAACRADEARLRSAVPSGDTTSTHFWSLVMRRCPGVRELATRGPQIGAAADILGPDVVLWWNQFVTKMPDRDETRGAFTWHQDNGYVDVSPGDNLTIWVALDDVDEVNGCVWVKPGSHLGGLLPHDKPRPDSWHLQVPVEGDGIPARLKPGEAVMFSGYTLHRSKANRSGAPRRAFFMQYAQADADLPAKNMKANRHEDAWVVRGSASA